MAIGLGPGKGKKKQASKPSKVYSKDGQMVAAPGYKLGLIRNAEHTKNPTKKITTGTGPAAVTRVQQQGIIGPIPTGPGGKAAAAAPKKKSAVGKVVKKVGRAISEVKNDLELAARRRTATSAYRGGGRRGGGGKIGQVCAAYFGYPTRRRR
jgi:hypothetical protein